MKAGAATGHAESVIASRVATYQLVKINPSILFVDQSVQRPIDSVRVAAIADDFKREALGVIHVSRRANGIHHIIDGQHRIAALRVVSREDDTVDCALWEGLNRAEEAAMFRRLNDTRQVQYLHRFRMRIVEGDPVACELSAMLASHGWTITEASTEGSFSAISALEKVYRAKDGGGIDTCDALVRIATEAWGHDSSALRAEIVAALGVLLRRRPLLDIPKLVTMLATSKNGPLSLIGGARQRRNMRNGRISDAIAEILANIYNHAPSGYRHA